MTKYLDHKIVLECVECSEKFGDSCVKDTPVINALVYCTMDVGLGYAAFHKLTGTMSMRPLYTHYQEVQSFAVKKNNKERKKWLLMY